MKEPRGVAQTLVRDYRVELLRAGETVAAQTVTANHQRRNAVSFDGTPVSYTHLVHFAEELVFVNFEQKNGLTHRLLCAKLSIASLS